MITINEKTGRICLDKNWKDRYFRHFLFQYMVLAQLSEADKQLLRVLVDSEGKIPTHEISQQLGIPLSTAQRMRNRLEETCLEEHYSLNLRKFGWRRIDLLIATEGGASISIGKELLKHDTVLSAARTIGEHTIDLRVETLVKEDGELLDLLEEVEAMKGVKSVAWTEIAETIGKKSHPNVVFSLLASEK